jgi:hypothetical protein
MNDFQLLTQLLQTQREISYLKTDLAHMNATATAHADSWTDKQGERFSADLDEMYAELDRLQALRLEVIAQRIALMKPVQS